MASPKFSPSYWLSKLSRALPQTKVGGVWKFAAGLVVGSTVTLLSHRALENQIPEAVDKVIRASSILPTVTAEADTKVPYTGVPGTYKERTFIAIKPDGVQRQLVGEVITRFEKKGYKLAGIKLIHPTKEFAAKHYESLSDKPFFPGLVEYFSSGPVVAMVWEGRNCIAGGRKLVGATRPDEATPGTIRGDFCIDTGRNVIHGSDGPESAQAEIALWFKENEIIDYDVEHIKKWVNEKN